MSGGGTGGSAGASIGGSSGAVAFPPVAGGGGAPGTAVVCACPYVPAICSSGFQPGPAPCSCLGWGSVSGGGSPAGSSAIGRGGSGGGAGGAPSSGGGRMGGQSIPSTWANASQCAETPSTGVNAD